MTFRRALLGLLVLAGVVLFAVNRRERLAREAEIAAEAGERAAAEAHAAALAKLAERRKAAATVPAPRGLPDVSTLPPVRLLFIGNSLVYSWNMPGMLTGLARASRINLDARQYAPGGWTLARHDAAPELRALLDAGSWHIVVIQEQSQLPALSDEVVRARVAPPAANLVRRARGSSPAAKIVFYLTPANRNGDPDNMAGVPALATYGGAQDRLTNTYRRLAAELDADVAPVGEAWRRVRGDRSDLELYSDLVHPNREGAYLTACVFYATLFNRDPTGSTYTGGVEANTARYLQRVAWETVQTKVSGSFRP